MRLSFLEWQVRCSHLRQRRRRRQTRWFERLLASHLGFRVQGLGFPLIVKPQTLPTSSCSHPLETVPGRGNALNVLLLPPQHMNLFSTPRHRELSTLEVCTLKMQVLAFLLQFPRDLRTDICVYIYIYTPCLGPKVYR